MEIMGKLFALSEKIYQQEPWVLKLELCFIHTDFKLTMLAVDNLEDDKCEFDY